MAKTGIKGIDDVVRNMNRELQRIQTRTLQGLIEATIDIRRDMSLVAPKIPIKYGNLRSSFFVVSNIGKWGSAPRTKIKPGTFKGKQSGQLASEYAQLAAEQKAAAEALTHPRVVLGFSAYYAGYVHENMEAKHWTEPGSGPKFFETHLKNNEKNIIKTAIKFARIPK